MGESKPTALALLKASADLLTGKSIKQIIAIAGSGKLADGNVTSVEFRSLLAELPSELLARYASECLEESFPDSGLVLQDLINEVGRRLGFAVENGRYRGKSGAIGNDGLWKLPNGHNIVVEVKTTDAYRIDLDVIADYRRELVRAHLANEDAASVLIVVGRADTGDLEAQVRGSRHAWDMRIISVDALVRLMKLKESLEDPDAVRRIYEVLIPREFTKLDAIVDLVFSTAEDAKQAESLLDEDGTVAPLAVDVSEARSPKFTPVAFNSLVAQRVSDHLGTTLVKRTRALFSSPDDSVRVQCVASREYDGAGSVGYWFAFHPHQRDALKGATLGYVAFGCGSPDLIVLVPIEVFTPWTDGMNITSTEERFYWHVQIFREGERLELVRRKGQPRIDLTAFVVGATPKARESTVT
jgi:hypothetical protein